MTRRREEGYCEVSTKRGQAWSLPREQYAPVLAAWLKGARYIDTVDFHGAPMTIKTDEIDTVADCSASVIAKRLEERRADEADDSLTGTV